MIFRPLDTPLEAKTQSDTHSIVRYSGDLQCVRISARFWGIFTVKSDWLVYYYKEVNKFWLVLYETLRTDNFKKSHSETQITKHMKAKNKHKTPVEEPDKQIIRNKGLEIGSCPIKISCW